VTDDQLDQLFAAEQSAVPSHVASKIQAEISSAKPVRVLRSTTGNVVILLLLMAVVALLGAYASGTFGLHVRSVACSTGELGVLTVLSVIAALLAVRAMRPGSGPLYSVVLGVAVVASYEILVALMFHDYSTQSFVRLGLRCFLLGMRWSAVAFVFTWLVVRQGAVVHPVRAGTLSGLISGLAGLALLEMHCPLLTLPHIGVWHVAVVPVSAALGAALGPVVFRWRNAPTI
jgi:hypothetical protein